MNAYGRNRAWLAVLAVLMMAAAFIACEGKRTEVSPSAPVVAPTAVPLPTATPKPAPPPAATPDYASQAFGFAAACSNTTATFNFNLSALSGGGYNLTWGELVETTDARIGAYSLLYPPPALQDYHNAQINLLVALRDRALSELSDAVVAQDFLAFLGPAIARQISQGPLTAAQQRAANAIIQAHLGRFLGTEFAQAAAAQQAAVAALSSELQELMAEANCTVTLG